MWTKRGIKVSPGIAIARALVIDAKDRPIPRRSVGTDKVQAEQERLDQALKASRADIQQQHEQAEARFGADLARIFSFHLGMLEDTHVLDQMKQMIGQQHITAEYAVFSVLRDLVKALQKTDNPYVSERAGDIWDIERRVLGHLIGEVQAELSHLAHESAIVARDLTPSQTATLDKSKIKAIAIDAGGQTSHTAILAHALGIPAIVGLENLTAEVNTGDQIIIDANNGIVVVNPDAAKLMEYRQESDRLSVLETTLDELASLPTQTADGTSIELWANIEFPSEIHSALEKGATGIGLYRTEFLFLAAEVEPTEDQQCEAYCEALRLLNGQSLTIRTLDLGADKLYQLEKQGYLERPEPNPFLGCRSIRLCLQNLPLFKTQLRAILRASTEGPLRIMFPLISNVVELRQAKMILSDVMEDLDEQGIAYRPEIPIGIMIEVPSAALQAATLAREVDFFSIGTNDLIQYTVAADRGNERIASLYTAAHPAVIRLIKEVVRAAARANIEVSLCGEMASSPEYAMFLVGLGLRSLSVTPPAILELKKILRSTTIKHCQRIARRVGGFDSAREVLNYLREELRKIDRRVAPATGLAG